MSGSPAARLDDPIAHTNAHARFWAKFAGGLIGGIVVGALAGAAVVAVVGTGGTAAPLVAAAAVGVARFGGGLLGAKAGEAIADTLVPETIEVTGKITTASPDVFINSKARGAARASPEVPIDLAVCSRDSPPVYLAEGSETVYVNTWVMSRKDDHTTCGAKISEGSPDVFVGGPTARVRDVADEVPFISKAIVTVLSLAMLVRGLACLPKLARQGRSALPCLVEGALSAGVGAWGLVSSIGNPIHAATGGKFLGGPAELDFELPGPLPLTWQRFYSSHDVRVDSALGQGWSTPYSVELRLRLSSTEEPIAVLYDEQGRDIEFPQIEPGGGIYSQSEGWYLWRSEGGRYIAQSIDGQYWLFEPVRDGQSEQSLKLERIEDRNANFIALRWDAQRRLHQITDSTGRLLQLHHDSAGRLTDVNLSIPAPDETPGVLVRYYYDSAGQLAEVIDRVGQPVRRFAYNADRLMVLHVDAAGLECHYEWQGSGKWARVTRHWTSDGEHYDISYSHLATDIASASDPNHTAGQTKATDQLGRIQHWCWNAQYRILSYANALGQVWLARYDELKQRLSLSLPDGATTTYRYDELGLLTAETDPLGRTWSTGWTPLGLPWRETAPDGSLTLYTYNEQGNLIEQRAPDGSTTRYIYDARGLPLRITDAKGGIKRLRWSPRAQLLEYTDCSGQTTRYEHDGRGQLTRITDALGQVTEFTHDAMGRLRAQALPDASHDLFGYDAAGRLSSVTDALSRVTRFAYNARSQLTARQDAEGRQVALTYDAAHRLQTLFNENGQRFDFRYDAADRLIEERRVGGQRVTVEYDANGWPVAVTHWPGVGDEAAGAVSGTAVAGTTPEIPQWGDTTDASASAAASAGAQRTELIRDAAGRLIEKHTGTHHYHYAYDPLDRLLSATKLALQPDGTLKPLHTTRFAYDAIGNLIEEVAVDEVTGQTHTLRHSHDALGNRTQTTLPPLAGQPDQERALNYLFYGSGHLHQINLSQRDASQPDALAVHQLISDLERDALHRETARSQGRAATRYALDPLGRRLGAWARSASLRTQPFSAQDSHWQQAILSAGTQNASALNGLMKAYAYDKVGELRQSRHSQRGDTAHAYDATGRIERSTRQPLAGQISGASIPSAPSEAFQYDPAGNLLDNASQAALQSRTQHLQAGYVKDNLVRVFEDKRFFYDGHGRLIRKLSGRHTAQRFTWDEENRLIEVSTTRRPGTEHETTQRTRFDYDALGRRVAKRDAFGTTTFIWEGMRLIEERRGSSVISYVYEPDSYVPLARLDAQGDRTEQGGLGTQEDSLPLPLGEGRGEGQPRLPSTTNSIANSRGSTPTYSPKSSQPAANDPETRYWASLNESASQRADALEIEGWATGTDGPQVQQAEAKLCEVYYFHTDQVGMPEELSNAQGQLVWQASYKTWGNTVSEQWQLKSLDGSRVHEQDRGDVPTNEARQQNLRFQGQYLDRDTGLHYNTFRYYDPDIGRFISPDPIGLEGGINLGSYSPNPISWIDPWGWKCIPNKVAGSAREARVQAKLEGRFGKPNVLSERYLRDANGKIVRDPVTGEARRVDFVIKGKDGKGTAVEVTSKTAPKTEQLRKEARIRSQGGTYVRDPKTKELIEVINTSRVIRLE